MRSPLLAAISIFWVVFAGITPESALAAEENEAVVDSPGENSPERLPEAQPAAKPAGGKKTRIEWKAALAGQFVDDDISEAKIVGLYGQVRVAHAFSELLTTNLEAGLELETGSTQQLHTNEFRPDQSISLHEARINFLPASFFKLHLGALSQKHHGSPIFISSKTFPAVMEYFYLNKSRWHFSANAQQAIPTSQTFSSRAIGKESTPVLTTANARFGYRDSRALELFARATHFNFRSLTRGLAYDGRFYGNTVLGTGVEGARFFYEYRGWEAGLDATVHFSPRWKFIAGNSFVNNAKAPRPKNRANYVFGGIKYAGSRVQLMPQAGFLRVESDSSPAFYTSKALGHNNRKGYFAGLQLRLVPEKVVFDALLVKAKVIDVTPVQADRTYVELKISTDYESF